MTIILGKESETLEFKETLAEIDDGGETIAGFANKGGGVLYFGIRNNGEVRGISDVNETTIRQTSQRYFDNLEPLVNYSIIEEIIDSKQIIVIRVEKSSTPHHTYKGKPYLRVGTSTKIMLQAEYTKRLLTYGLPNKDYSSQTVSGATIDDLSPEAISELRKLLIQSARYDVDINGLSNEQLLKDLLLTREGKLTIAAIVLLGTELCISKYLPYSEIRYGYKVSEDELRNQDTDIFKEGYFLYYNKIWQKIQSRNITIDIPLGMRLVQKKAFDEQSIREAINNAIVHRDYQIAGSIILLQYPKKIVFKSPGGLPEGVTIENIIDETRPRNKLLADILFKCELVEQFGNGVNLMYRNQLSLGKSPPNFTRTTDSSVDLELDGSIQDIEFAKYVLRVAEAKHKELNDNELIILNKIKCGYEVDSNQTVLDLLNLGLIEKSSYHKFMLSKPYYVETKQTAAYTRTKGFSWTKQKELILDHLKNFKKGTKSDFSELFEYKLTPKHINGLLSDLKKDGKIIYTGQPKSAKGYWKLVS